MKKIASLSLCSLFAIYSMAQPGRRVTDSLKHYERELKTISLEYRNAMMNDPKYQELIKKSRMIRAASDNYKGFVFYTLVSSLNTKQFNADNAQAGFGPLSQPAIALGYGFSFKKNRRIFNLDLLAGGFQKTTKSGDKEISTSFSTLLQLEWGYDFIKNNRVNMYPYAGVGLRQSTLTYEAIISTNPSFTNITDIILNNSSVDETTTEVSYQAGIGFELALTRGDRPGGTLVFIKAGTNRPFNKEKFEIGSQRYDPQLNYGDWTITVGFKFFGR